MQTVRERIKFLRETTERERLAAVARIDKATGRIRELADRVVLTRKTAEAARMLQELVSGNTISYVEEFLTRGLLAVYPTKRIRIRIAIGDRGTTKTAEIFGEEEIDGHVVLRPLENNFGGGIQVIIAPLLQALTIINRGLHRVLFLDESFLQVSEEYQDGVLILLKVLVKQFDFKILLITQLAEYARQADRIYYIRDGRAKLMASFEEMVTERKADYAAEQVRIGG